MRRDHSGGRGREPAHVILRRVEQKLDTLINQVARNEQADRKRDEKMSKETKAAFAEVQADAAAETDTVKAIGIVVDKLVEMLAEDDVSLDDVKALGAQLKSNRDALAAAIVKGTPADPNAPA